MAEAQPATASDTPSEGNGTHAGMAPHADKEGRNGDNDVKQAATNGSDAKTEDDNAKAKNDKKEQTGKRPNKRRKVNHACVYCRRSHMTCDLERPCARCIKRDIGHLCHDEPREPAKRTKSDLELAPADDFKEDTGAGADTFQQTDDALAMTSAGAPVAGAPMAGQMGAPPIAQPKPVSPTQVQHSSKNNREAPNVAQWDFGSNQQLSDIHHLHSYNAFTTTEIGNEYNLLGDFLNSTLLDDTGGMFNPDEAQALFNDPYLNTSFVSNLPSGNTQNQAQSSTQAQAGNEISRPSSTFPVDTRARDKFFLTAADPAGNDSPEERMNRLLKAKYDAGMLKPFSYAKGYARLNTYMEANMRAISRQKILRQLNQFRPKFREAMHRLTDIQLVMVEMWFERSLMEYDRVFTSMAIPACCWRRTGEIYRGNKAMSELIHAPMENLRDGKIALHEIMAEDSLVSYWEKFGAIAFDQSQKAILTSCSLKNPDPNSKDPFLRCCFSFTIRRDTHNIPAMIVGNFLPILPE